MSNVLHLYNLFFIFHFSVLRLQQFLDDFQNTLLGYYQRYGNLSVSSTLYASYISYVMK